MCSGRISSSYSTSGIRRVTLISTRFWINLHMVRSQFLLQITLGRLTLNIGTANFICLKDKRDLKQTYEGHSIILYKL